MYCHHCGTHLPTGANFCASCGTKAISGATVNADTAFLNDANAVEVTSAAGQESRNTQSSQEGWVFSPQSTANRGLRVLQHSVAIMLASLLMPSIWKSPNLIFGIAAWSVVPVISLGLAGLITGIAFVFFPRKAKSEWPGLFVSIAWVITGFSLIGAFIGMGSH